MIIGFSEASYNVSEGEGYLLFQVEVKNGATFEQPIAFTVTDSEGDALSEFSELCDQFHVKVNSIPIPGGVDYSALGIVTLELQPGETSVGYEVAIIDDNVTEVDQETFTLNLRTEASKVSTLAGFDQVEVTIHDEDSK